MEGMVTKGIWKLENKEWRLKNRKHTHKKPDTKREREKELKTESKDQPTKHVRGAKRTISLT